MIVRSITFLAAACVTLVAATPARAWDTAPWDATPFDQITQVPADVRAKIARVEAEDMARAGSARGDKSSRDTSIPSLVTDGRRGCSVNLGNVALTRGAGAVAAAVSTNVQVKGDVITVCR